MKLQTWNTRMV